MNSILPFHRKWFYTRFVYLNKKINPVCQSTDVLYEAERENCKAEKLVRSFLIDYECEEILSKL